MRKDLMTVVLLVFCLTVVLFMIVPIESRVGYYDPWLDFNDDGKIDIKDLASAAIAYGTYGDPTKNVTVTNWPFDEDGNLKVSIQEKPPQIYKHREEIVALEWSSMERETDHCEMGVPLHRDFPQMIMPFIFSPHEGYLNVTDLWVRFTALNLVGLAYTFEVNVTINGAIAVSTSDLYPERLWGLKVTSVHITDSDIYQILNPGINKIVLSQDSDWLLTIFRVVVFVEYEYLA